MFSSTSPEAGIYAEHFDSICEKDDIAQISSFLNDLSLDNIHNQTIILYVSPNNISDSIWSPVLEKFIHLELVYILCIDKYHYITSTRHHFRLDSHIHIGKIGGLLWIKCPIVFGPQRWLKPSCIICL